MVQVIKKTKVGGVTHETKMAFSDNEWKTIQRHYPFGGVSFELAGGQTKSDIPKAKPGREKGDDKPNMNDYLAVKERGMELFKEENWDKAIYYFQAAYKLKSHGWLNGKINTCRKNLRAHQIANPKK